MARSSDAAQETCPSVLCKLLNAIIIPSAGL